MALESGDFIDDLTITNPPGTDAKSQGDDHLRLIKKVVKATFPGMGGAAWRVQAKSGAYTVVVGDNMTLLNCTAALTLTLTAAATLGNQHMFIAHANGGDITIDPNASETINGTTTQVIKDGSSALVVCNGTLFLAFVAPNTLSATDFAFLGTAQIFTKIQRFTKGGDIASASPLVLDTDGNYFDVTGTTGFSQITCTAGDFFMLQFDGILVMTDGANLDLGGANITTAAGDRGLFYAVATNTAQLISWVTEGSAISGSPRSYLAGLTLSNDTDTAHDVNVTAGVARSDTDDIDLILASEQTKRIDASWATGNDAGGLSSSLTVANNTWYHIHLILVAGKVEVGIDTSITAANLVTDHSATKFRRIGSVLTNGSANIIAFVHVEGETFQWTVPVGDIADNNPGTSAVTRTLTVPTGVVVYPIYSFTVLDTGSAQLSHHLITALSQTDTAPSSTIHDIVIANGGEGESAMSKRIPTNTSAQVRTRASASDAGITHTITTSGWIDPRGRNA